MSTNTSNGIPTPSTPTERQLFARRITVVYEYQDLLESLLPDGHDFVVGRQSPDEDSAELVVQQYNYGRLALDLTAVDGLSPDALAAYHLKVTLEVAELLEDMAAHYAQIAEDLALSAEHARRFL